MENKENIDIEKENIETPVEDKKDEKLYTKDELTEKIQKEVAKVKSKQPQVDENELNEFKQWKQSQLTEQEKLAEKQKAIEEKERELLEKEKLAQNKLKEAEILKLMNSKGIPTKSIKLFMDDIQDLDNLDEEFEKVLNEHDYLIPKELEKPMVKTGYEKPSDANAPKSKVEEMEEYAKRKGYIKN